MKTVQYKGHEIKIRKIKGFWVSFIDGKRGETDSLYSINELNKAKRFIDRNGRPE